MKAERIHYAGGVEYTKTNGALVIWAAGWPCCCSGTRARAIKAAGMQSTSRAAVTCKACLRTLGRVTPKNIMEKPAGPMLAKLAGQLPAGITVSDVVVVGAALADFFRGDRSHALTRTAGAVVYPAERSKKLGEALDVYEAKERVEKRPEPQARPAGLPGLALVCRCGVIGCSDPSPLLAGRHASTLGAPAPLAGGWPRR